MDVRFVLVEPQFAGNVGAAARALKNLGFHPGAGKSRWFLQGSVHLLAQRFGASVLLVATRSPSRTEDLDLGLGLTFLAEGNVAFAHTIFVDAHNSAGDIGDGVYCGTRIATDYHTAVHPQRGDRRRQRKVDRLGGGMPRRMKIQLTGFELKRVHELAWTTEKPNELPEPDRTKVRLLLSAEKTALDRGFPPASVTKAILWVNDDGTEFVEFALPNPKYGATKGGAP